VFIFFHSFPCVKVKIRDILGFVIKWPKGEIVRFSLAVFNDQNICLYFLILPQVSRVKIGYLLEFFAFPIGWGIKTST
jgi:hypothetical protein